MQIFYQVQEKFFSVFRCPYLQLSPSSPAIEYHCLISSIAAAPGSMSPLISAAAFGENFSSWIYQPGMFFYGMIHSVVYIKTVCHTSICLYCRLPLPFISRYTIVQHIRIPGVLSLQRDYVESLLANVREDGGIKQSLFGLP